ncbi:MAG: hypothetical protein ACO1OB_15000 [Archangium sp.]
MKLLRTEVAAPKKPMPIKPPPKPPVATATGTIGATATGFVKPPKPGVVLSPFKPKVTQAEAIAAARELLSGAPLELQQGSHIVVSDPEHANSGNDVEGPRADSANAQLAANAELEAAALAQLSTQERTQYLRVQRQLSGDPVAKLALQTLLLENALPGGELLQNLAKLTTQKLADGVDRARLVADVVQEVTTPTCMAQQNKNTCVATAASIQLVMQNPAEYVRLISGLASPEGTVTTLGGDVLKREITPSVDDARTLSAQLLTPALMELGNSLLNYDDASDSTQLGPLGLQGLLAFGADVVAASITGRDYTWVQTIGPFKPMTMDAIEAQLEKGVSVLAGINYQGLGGHELLVTGLETRDGKEYVRVINPWGQEELIPREEFQENLVAIAHQN